MRHSLGLIVLVACCGGGVGGCQPGPNASVTPKVLPRPLPKPPDQKAPQPELPKPPAKKAANLTGMASPGSAGVAILSACPERFRAPAQRPGRQEPHESHCF
jgi:hypothetical protein